MMQVDYIIIGQGISGTFLSWQLLKEGKNIIVIDNDDKNSPSRIAAGIINPVTGRRHVTVWMAEEILPFALEAYKEIGHHLGITAISHKNIIDFFPNPQMRLSFLQRIEESDQYVRSYPEQNHFNPLFHYDFGCGEIHPVYIVHLETLLPVWRQQLKEQQLLIEEEFDNSRLQVKEDHIEYNNIKAGKIIFCDGNSSATSTYFGLLPFAPNKGELLIAEIPDLPTHHIYKKGMMMVPLATPGLWWIGSNYGWEFDNDKPTTQFRESTQQLLKSWLKLPFTIVDHLAGIRPATLERRPFVGFHPLYKNVGLLNGMGTKGCSLAPFFARQLADNMMYNKPVAAEADIKRFSRILTK